MDGDNICRCYEAIVSYFRLSTIVKELEFQAQPLMHAKEGTVPTDANVQHKSNNDTDLQVEEIPGFVQCAHATDTRLYTIVNPNVP